MTAKKTTKKQEIAFDYKVIKSFEDACKKECIDPNALPDLSNLPDEFKKPMIAHYKLMVIFKAINNGWIPNWNVADYKYFPWFEVEASDEQPSGFGFSCSGYDSWYSLTCVGSRLCTYSREVALYIAKQFEQEYIDLFLIQ